MDQCLYGVLTGLLGYSIRLHSCDTPPYAYWLARPSRQHKTESPQLTVICLSIQLILNITYKDQGTGNSQLCESLLIRNQSYLDPVIGTKSNREGEAV